MVVSMTGYGVGKSTAPEGEVVVELQTVNRRHLDIHLSLPDTLRSFEIFLRKKVAEVLFRGKISLKVTLKGEHTARHLKFNLSLAKQIQKGCEQLVVSDPSQFLIHCLAQRKDLFLEEEGEVHSLEKPLEKALSEALEGVIKMRKEEGAALQKDLSLNLSSLKEMVKRVDPLQEKAVEKLREKLRENIEAVVSGAVENEERILREIAIYAEKMDVSEEISRLHSHIEQVEKLLQVSEEMKGKKLDFLIQEMMREVNTFGNKSGDFQVVNMKAVCERMREQVQNVE